MNTAKQKAILFLVIAGGTVFLDEIETMPLALQVKLLRVLQERKLERLGGNDPISIDCRVIAASKANLLELSAQGSSGKTCTTVSAS